MCVCLVTRYIIIMSLNAVINRFQLEKTLTDKSAEAEAQAREIADNRRRLQHLNQANEELRVRLSFSAY